MDDTIKKRIMMRRSSPPPPPIPIRAGSGRPANNDMTVVSRLPSPFGTVGGSGSRPDPPDPLTVSNIQGNVPISEICNFVNLLSIAQLCTNSASLLEFRSLWISMRASVYTVHVYV